MFIYSFFSLVPFCFFSPVFLKTNGSVLMLTCFPGKIVNEYRKPSAVFSVKAEQHCTACDILKANRRETENCKH